MGNFWLDYVNICYELVTESAARSSIVLDHTIEAYIVHLMARNMNRTDIGSSPVAIQMLEAVQKRNVNEYLAIADECLLIHSYPLRARRWPTPTYYHEMGTTAYGLAGHEMEHSFGAASQVLNRILGRQLGYKL